MQQKLKKQLGLIIALLFFVIGLTSQVLGKYNLPDRISLTSGEAKECFASVPLDTTYNSEDKSTITDNTAFAYDNTIIVSDKKTEDVIKNEAVEQTTPKTLVVGGQAIGVKLHTKGALVVGITDFTSQDGETVNPAKNAGISTGDIIEKVNNETVQNATHLSELINKFSSKTINLSIRRGDTTFNIKLTPIKDKSDGAFKIGTWVRDSTAGVGTLTFYDPKTMRYASLGHAITDVDTKTNLSVGNGEIVISRIIDIKLGEKGTPGELKGSFTDDDKAIGTIDKNTDYGIYGTLKTTLSNPLYQVPLEVGKKEEVKLGKATILCTLDNTGIKEYECEIIKINTQDKPSPKSMVVKITDKRLLDRTGGIVQGMSGSPIIQDGKIIGAVTHVFINDPTQGYGIFVEWMIEQL